MAEYDKIAKDYSEIEELRPERPFFINYSLLGAIGDVKGKKVLDLACGNGYFSRKLLVQNPSEIVAVDISEEMIKLAKANPKNKGIKFVLGDVNQLKKLGEFDIAIAGFLLHYAKTKDELFNMCKNIYSNLKKGGSFITINNNPLSPEISDPKYGITVQGQHPIKEGSKLNVKLFNEGKSKISFTNYYWNKKPMKRP